MKKTILVAYDGSENSKLAVEEAKVQASIFPKSSIFILSVVSQSSLRTSYPRIAVDMEQQMAEEIQDELQDIKEAIVTENANIHVEVIVDQLPRNAGRVIVEYADENDIDLIIVGSRGLGGVKGTILGSVSNQVVQHATCNVLLIK